MIQIWMLGDATPSPPPEPGGGNALWPLIGGLLGFAAILVLSYYGLRVLSRKNLFAARGRHMQIIDRMVLGRDCTILLTRVAGRILILGVSKEGVRTLGELDAGELTSGEAEAVPATHAARGAPPDVRGFFRRFTHNLGVYSGLLPKGTPPARPKAPAPEGEGATSFQEVLLRSQEELATDSAAEPEPEPGPAPQPEPVQGETRAEDAESVRPDYNEAIVRMKRYGRMELDPRPEPSPADSLTFLQAARSYAAQQKLKGGERPPPAQTAPADPRDPAPPPAPADRLDLLAGRIGKRMQRLSDRIRPGGGNGSE